MTLVSTSELVAGARSAGGAAGALNIVTLEHAEAVVAGAESAGLPVVLQISQNCVRFHGGRLAPLARAAVALAEASTVDVAVHVDHVDELAVLHQAGEVAGIGSVMFDGSRLPFDANVAATAGAVEWAHARGLWVEAELGEVGGKPGAHTPGARTDPEQAAAFVEATGVDALAVAVGSTHRMTTRTATLDHALIRALTRAVPVPLVLHGSSGVPDGELRRAIAAGIAKVNIGTALNVAFTGAIRRRLAAEPDAVDPRTYLAEARAAVAATTANLLATLRPPAGATVVSPSASGPGRTGSGGGEGGLGGEADRGGSGGGVDCDGDGDGGRA